MGMIEFLWGLSDGVNAAGLALALAYGGRSETAPGFGVTTILRYVIETCGTVEQALAVLRRVPSHMAYNVTLADRHGATATAELIPGGGARIVSPAIATNHQQGPGRADRPDFTRTYQRRAHLARLLDDGIRPDALAAAFLEAPLFQTGYDAGFGTLFTAECDPVARSLTLRWPDRDWRQTLDGFVEGRRHVRYGQGGPDGELADDPLAAVAAIVPHLAPAPARALGAWVESARRNGPDWAEIGRAFHA
jgi:predicted choloylglycine hydrolase